MGRASRSRRVRVERGIYLQPNGKYAVCLRRAGRLCYHAVGFDLELARRERQRLIAATQHQLPPRSPRLRFDTVAYRWLERFEANSPEASAMSGRSRLTGITSTATSYQHSLPGESRRCRSMTSPH